MFLVVMHAGVVSKRLMFLIVFVANQSLSHLSCDISTKISGALNFEFVVEDASVRGLVKRLQRGGMGIEGS